jgi:hypothetical protein
MRAHRKRCVVSQLPFFFDGVRLSCLRSATGKCFLHVNRRSRIVSIQKDVVVLKLNARFVNDRLIDDRRFRKLNTLLGGRRVVSA